MAVGAPIGPRLYVEGWCNQLVNKASIRIGRIAQMPRVHCSLATLYFTSNAQLVNYWLRLLGPMPAWEVFDTHVRGAVTSLVSGIGGVQANTLLFLPQRSGGMGIRSAENHAMVAHLASLLDCEARTHALLRHVTVEGEPVFALRDPRIDVIVPTLPVAIQQHPASASAPPGSVHSRVKRQHQFSKVVNGTIFGTLHAILTPEEDGRCKSAAAQFSGAWIAPLNPWKGSWLSNDECTTAWRVRLGLTVQSAPVRCVMCNTGAIADVNGHHSLSCMSGGHRIRAHNSLRDNTGHFMTVALWSPRFEQRPFPNNMNIRVDILTSSGIPRELGCDVALISPYAHTAQARRYPGGASDAYAENQKLGRVYRNVRNDPRIEVVPLIVDAIGAWNDRAKVMFKVLARQYATQTGISTSAALEKIMMTQAMRVQRGVAELISFNRLAALTTAAA